MFEKLLCRHMEADISQNTDLGTSVKLNIFPIKH